MLVKFYTLLEQLKLFLIYYTILKITH